MSKNAKNNQPIQEVILKDYREEVKTKLNDIFSNYKTKIKYNKEELIGNIEKSIYNHSLNVATKRLVVKKWDNPEFVEIYKDIVYQLLTNLDKSSYIGNDGLLKKVINNEIDITKMASMTSQELYPEIWEKIFQDKLKKENLKYETSMATTDLYTCRKCKKAKATFYSVQLRAADEPMTTILNCVECGYQWRIN